MLSFGIRLQGVGLIQELYCVGRGSYAFKASKGVASVLGRNLALRHHQTGYCYKHARFFFGNLSHCRDHCIPMVVFLVSQASLLIQMAPTLDSPVMTILPRFLLRSYRTL